ncbi:MAG: PQQ-binding-like beta-propeller repeat protein [Lachnospiraceae bacterium]|nr:PQQ-binding-like beta-propeller repeat protein [Lachnospiraceae bacterium]
MNLRIDTRTDWKKKTGRARQSFTTLLLTALLAVSLCLGNTVHAKAESPSYPREPEKTEVKWHQTINPDPSSGTNNPSQVVELKGYLYIVGGGFLYKLDPEDGHIISKADDVANGTNVFLTSNEDDTIFVQDSDYVYDAAIKSYSPYYKPVRAYQASDLKLKWTSNLPSSTSAGYSPLTYKDGYVYGNDGKTFFALNAENGEKRWSKDSQNGISNSAPLVLDNVVIFGDNSGTLYSYNKTYGTELDTLSIGENQAIYSSFTYADGKLYYITHNPNAGWGNSASPELHQTLIDSATGAFSNDKSVTLPATDSTTTPRVKNGKIYVGGSYGSDGIVALYDTDLNLLGSKTISGMGKTYNIQAFDDPDDPDNTLLYSAVFGSSNPSDYSAKDPGTAISLTEKNGVLSEPLTYSSLTDPLSKSYSNAFSDAQITLGSDGTLYYSNDSGVLLALKAKESPASASQSDQENENANEKPKTSNGQVTDPKSVSSTGNSASANSTAGLSTADSKVNSPAAKSPATGETPSFPLLPLVLFGLAAAVFTANGAKGSEKKNEIKDEMKDGKKNMRRSL